MHQIDTPRVPSSLFSLQVSLTETVDVGSGFYKRVQWDCPSSGRGRRVLFSYVTEFNRSRSFEPLLNVYSTYSFLGVAT